MAMRLYLHTHRTSHSLSLTAIGTQIEDLRTNGDNLVATIVKVEYESGKTKEYLNQIADRLTKDSTLEDVYEQLSLFADIDEFKEQVEKGEVLSQKEIEEQSKEWFK